MIEYAILAGSVGIFLLVLIGVGLVVIARSLRPRPPGTAPASPPAPASMFYAAGKSLIDLIDEHEQSLAARARRAKLEEKAAGLVADPKAP